MDPEAGETISFKKRVVLLCTLSLCLFLIANIIAFSIAQVARNKHEKHLRYEDDIQGRISLAKKLYPETHPDIIFLGNSITKDQVNTSLFNKNGIKVFNFSVDGYFVYQYPAMIEEAIKLHPKAIVLSVEVLNFNIPFKQLNTAYYTNSQDLHFDSLHFVMHQIDTRLLFKTLKLMVPRYLYTLNYFRSQGHVFRQYLSEQYRLFQDGKFLVGSVEPVFTPFLACDFDSNGKRVPFDCQNGDGSLPGHIANLIPSEYRLDVYCVNQVQDQNFAHVIDALVNKISAAGIQPIIILPPSFKHYIINKELISKTIHAPIIDLSDLVMPVNYWYDYEHLNVQGRQVYSLALLEQLKRGGFTETKHVNT